MNPIKTRAMLFLPKTNLHIYLLNFNVKLFADIDWIKFCQKIICIKKVLWKLYPSRLCLKQSFLQSIQDCLSTSRMSVSSFYKKSFLKIAPKLKRRKGKITISIIKCHFAHHWSRRYDINSTQWCWRLTELNIANETPTVDTCTNYYV